ncbi:amino acid transporter [Rhizobium sp. Root1204]|uniref:nucleotidyltransferase domain-containing protein n=2 Tax=Rhizobium TaxID=379 RepID=UPI000A4FCF64|nr:amino acid transporter [Rhizobium sp. Root1204]
MKAKGVSMNALKIPDHDAWSAWHPLELAARLSGVTKPWCVVGGWALDLWHGEQIRDHDDLEFTVLREHTGIFRDALKGLEFYTAGSGVVTPLPHGVEPPADIAQIWCMDAAARRWRVDMMIEPGTEQTWVCKRDPQIHGPRHDFVRKTVEGIPYLAPAAILLFKAKYQRTKDEADFETALPKLTTPERKWLKASLGLVHPGHDWIGVL